MKSFLSEWQKFRGWSVLEFFLKQPERSIHVKGLAKELGISPRTANTYLNLYGETGILEKEKVANAIFFKMADNAVARELKKFFSLARIFESGSPQKIENEMRCNSLALFGSYAKGTNDSSSDLDLLLISSEKKLPENAAGALKKVFQGEINVISMGLNEWQKKVREGNAFAKAILRSHVILCGSDLVE